MASPSFPHDDYENDEFDWEAAVREIDSACQSAVASTSNQVHPGRPIPTKPSGGACPKPAKPFGGARQSTLDRFVDSFAKSGNGGDRRHRSCVQESESVGLDQAAAVKVDLEAAKTWIYPVNVPRRDYQFSIAETALFSNTLVALPTGLGKTLIAAVVMYNYFRWFPEGKIVFTAPSRPLVMQQIEACHNIVGISQEWTIDMTGQMSPSKRSSFWKAKRVFFVTPQVLEKDIQSGICLVKQIVCLVIDEAHRALGNYSYCVAVRELMAVPVQLRILALTATPGSKQRVIQNVINNLCISTLEYRNESDCDVNPYVHERKLELIEVAMGKDAIGINNLLLEAIQPFVGRLCEIGVLYHRDFSTLSPCELLNSRDKFRQAPPLNLPPAKYGEVEACYGVLITAYHIRKLLSSHGIRPAFEMFEDKLRVGPFARAMSRNETIWKAKLLMQQSLSHGVPNPKLVKMTEVLIDHFKKKDPKDSRVIIFSNFRGSVKDIMESLSNIGDLVKATEFIGQSSGKTSKGQTQKVQQAVLQKFRAGGYNVIVATSIGEEGLDIMEVDLVICFDANISPLRMIQRMGRTGRKNDGRVVVLACEGSELKGYLKKQASSKAVRKHMHNGGTKSFDFHSSPRMVPHICKPEVQLVELSIEQFIPRGRKVKDDVIDRSPFSNKMSSEENDLITRYFHQSKEDTWRPSLIAFPHFQAFPSRVHKVRHSFKTTGMLIDAMQHLEGLSLSKAKEVMISSSRSLKGVAVAYDDEILGSDPNDIHCAVHNDPKALLQSKISGFEASSVETSGSKDWVCMPDPPGRKPSVHCFLFRTDFVTVNAFGSVCIASVPVLPFKGPLGSEVISTEKNNELLSNTNKDASYFRTLAPHYGKLTMQLKHTAELTGSTHSKFIANEGILSSQLPKYGSQQEAGIQKDVLHTSVPNGKLTILDDCAADTSADAENIMPVSLMGELGGILKDIELSPRLTHFIQEGIVPESPIVEISHYTPKADDMVYTRYTPEHGKCAFQANCPSAIIHEKKVSVDVTSSSKMPLDTLEKNESLPSCHLLYNTPKLFSDLSSKILSSPKQSELAEVQSSVSKIDILKINISGSPVNEEIRTPLGNPNNSSSEDWQLNSGEVPKSFLHPPKFKRLCRYRDIVEKLPCKNLEEKLRGTTENTCEPITRIKSSRMDCDKGKQRKEKIHVNSLIEVEAEVSEDAEVSKDEEDSEDEDTYDDSFIDDRINPTEATTQAETSGGDMMAFYRRSLLTQSPIASLPTCMNTSNESISPRTAESGSCTSETVYNSLQTPNHAVKSANQSTGRNSVTYQLESERTTAVIPPGESSRPQREHASRLESRKRKLSFQQAATAFATNFQPEHVIQTEHTGKAPLRSQLEHNELNTNVLYDDDFYENLDLDAVEAQATKLLRYKSEFSTGEMQRVVPSSSIEIKGGAGVNFLGPPSFDLGI